MEIERKLCKRCGNWFVTKGQNTMCQYCIATTLGEFQKTAPARRKKSKPQVETDANIATELGMSYGYYMAWKEGRR